MSQLRQEQTSGALAHGARIPSATYQLQFTPQFTFGDAAELVPYLHALGISDCYASPYFQACPGSPHGYDVLDHNALNPELGGEPAYNRFVQVLQRHRLGDLERALEGGTYPEVPRE